MTTSSRKNAELVGTGLIDAFIGDGLNIESESVFGQYTSEWDEIVVGCVASRALELLQLVNNREDVEVVEAEVD